MNIIICEDSYEQRKKFEKIIGEQIVNLNINLEIAISTDNAKSVLKHLDKAKCKTNIYFLDIELEDSINGLELAKKIREYDSRGYIVFISSHTEMPILTFEYKVQALDFIFKSDINLKDKIGECLKVAYEDYNKEHSTEANRISINIGNKVVCFELEDILFFETTGKDHRIRVHAINEHFEFYGAMKDIEKQVSEDYYKTHRSYLVNTKRIKAIDKKELTIEMINGEICYVSRLNMKGLLKKWSI